MTIHEANRLQELEEILGLLHTIEKTELGMLALIGKIQVLLPLELAGKLEGLIGKHVGVLRLDGYHIRDMEGEKHATRYAK